MAGFREWPTADGPRETGLRVRRRPSQRSFADPFPACRSTIGSCPLNSYMTRMSDIATIVTKITTATLITPVILTSHLHERPLNGKGNPGAAGFY